MAKVCSICGGGAKFFSRVSLGDGIVCGHCWDRKSPWTKEINTIAALRTHLQYRDQNMIDFDRFTQTKVMSVASAGRIYVDEQKKLWVLAREFDLRRGNPDILLYSQLTDFTKNENVKVKYDYDADGREYRYEYHYYTYTLCIDSPWFSTIEFVVEGDDSAKAVNAALSYIIDAA